MEDDGVVELFKPIRSHLSIVMETMSSLGTRIRV
jgi:hypothetical protein